MVKRACVAETYGSSTTMSDEGERPTTTGPRISTCRPLSDLVPFSTSTDQMAESVRCPLTRPMPVRMAAKRKT